MSAHNAPNNATEFTGWVVPGYVAAGDAVPTDATPGFNKGCMFIHTDGASVDDLWYINVGTSASCDFNALNLTEV